MLLCVLHKWRAKHLLIYFHALKLRLIFIEDDFFLLSKMLKTWWRFFGKDWKKRFQKTKWFPYIWFTDANWCYKIKFTRYKMYNLVKKSTYLPSARIFVLFVWTINHRIEFKAPPGQAFLLNKLLTIKTHLKFELIFAI